VLRLQGELGTCGVNVDSGGTSFRGRALYPPNPAFQILYTALSLCAVE
jgi:hypothetical protein